MAKSRRFQELDRGALKRVIGGADIGGMLQMASPLLGMMPGGSMISSFLPMIGQLASKGGSGGNAQAAAPQQQVASAQQAPQSAGDDMSQGQPALTGGGGSPGGGGGRHHASVSVEIG
jgi:hypothetical protein